MFEKVLIANRGEIAVRIARALEELGVDSVAVYSELDRDAPHVSRAGEAYNLGDGPAAQNYLSIEKILDVASSCGAQAIHPGYGFLAENAAFAQACEQAGVVFIGPPASAIEAMGSKTRARELMKAAGVPIVPGTTEPVATVADALAIAREQIGFPVAVKASGGGGGKGFRVALGEDELQGAFEGASREGEKFFSDPTVYLERYLHDPRHVEVQVLADRHGNVIHLGERDCSIQRRHQKVIEESPAPEWIVDERMRARIGQIGVEAARAVDYVGAGTIEGLFVSDPQGASADAAEYFFLEMNTRVQVEHCVTEMTTGIDIVKEGIRAAAGEELSIRQDDVVLSGHAIECRINAEDASKNFAPAPGRIGAYREPSGPGVRVDSGVQAGAEVSPMYDPMVAKLIVWDADRAQATRRMLRALGEFEIEGLKTLIPFHRALLASEQWERGETCRDLLEDREWLKRLAFAPAVRDAGAAEPQQELLEQTYAVEVSGKRFDVRVLGPPFAAAGAAGNGAAPSAPKPKRSERASSSSSAGEGDVLAAPLQGNMWKVLVKQGDTVEEGQLLCIIEAMKMENEITAHKAGTIVELPISEGAPILAGAPIATIRSAEGAQQD
ncbi:MAG: acetyl-CoA/propionyl-CoA carboxylase, biotin carboxylase, biotin carboxyl carrier protein [Solirubrobacteraceae bacterium]|jgi:acetyl-CoA/propionyl-CoA carboxylase biotin carboxyl carrier protein|nr:acetyl-CoA/propionyl-CoA carboxylase, biotin carboxylase, biotin carboxyl carrier protein [Solirubrobacteraceae bacterium]